MTYNVSMARRRKSLLGSVVSTAIFGAAAASIGYVAYKAIRKEKLPSSATSLSEKALGKNMSEKDAKPRAAVRREITPPAPRTSPEAEKVSQDHLQWLPGLRAREQRILSSIPSGKRVKMADIARFFPHVTVRTLRRDMDRLTAKGRVRKEGTTRSTTYIKA